MRVLQRRASRQFALAACLLACVPSPLRGATLLHDVHALESAGRLDQARARLEELNKAASEKTSTATDTDKAGIGQHLGFLDGTIAMLAASRRYEAEGQVQRAIDALTQYATQKLTDPREAYLALAVHRRIVELQPKLPADAVARAKLTRADTLFQREEYKAAREAYAEVSAMTDPISDDSKSRARRGVAKATDKEFGELPIGLPDTAAAKVAYSLCDGATTVLEWLLTFVSFLLPVAILLWILPRLLLKNERSLELVDQGAASPAANRELTQELQDAIDRIGRAGPGSAKLAATGLGDSANEDGKDLPAPTLAFVTAPVDAPELAQQLDAFVSSSPAVTFGGIGLNPVQLWTLIKRLFTRRARHAFSGTLTTYDNTLTLRVTREDRLFGRKTEWRSSAPSASAEARISCLVDIAARIVLDASNGSTATGDCHSLKEYILGLYALGGNTTDGFKNATPHFQAALDRDENNWLARFQLALCAHGRKDTRTAVNHLAWFSGATAASSPSLRKHIEKHPDFPFVVQYQLASTLSLASEDREEPEVGRILDRLIALETSEAGEKLEPGKRLRLVMLARSGQASRDAVRCSLVRNDQGVVRDARQRLRDHVDWFDRHADELQRAAPTGHPLARGIVLHAHGRTQFSSGDQNRAIQSLSEAVDLMPTYADVRVDLAKAYLEHKGKRDWPRRVDQLLKRALELDPESAKAKFVYARFYFAEETRDFAKAEPYLTSAPFDATSLFMLAQALSNRGAYAETLSALERAIALQENGPAFRVRLYADSLLELVKMFKDPTSTVLPKPNKRALERARRQLCAYDNDRVFDAHERTQGNYRRVAELYAEICKELGIQQADGCFALPPPLAPTVAPPGPAAKAAPGLAAAATGEPAAT